MKRHVRRGLRRKRRTRFAFRFVIGLSKMKDRTSLLTTLKPSFSMCDCRARPLRADFRCYGSMGNPEIRSWGGGKEMRLVLLIAALLLSAFDMAFAQSCGSRKGQACVICCQGTGRPLSTCEKYCSADAAGKARGNKRESCLAKAGVSRQEAASVRRSDPRHAVYHACMGS